MFLLISSVRVKKLGTFQDILLKCPDCTHDNWYKVEYKDRTEGDEEVTCHLCGAILTFHWRRQEGIE